MSTLERRDQLTLDQLSTALRERRTRAIDLVAPARSVHFDAGALVVAGLDPVMDDSGVTDPNGRYVPTPIGDEGLGVRLDIPNRYMVKMRNENLPLYDENVNGWLEHTPDRSFLFRLLRSDEATETRGVLRAVLSPRYRTIDDFDVLLAVLNGLKDGGVPITDIRGELTDRRMIVRVQSEAVAAAAPQLLAGYRSPYTGQTGADNPLVFAGFVVTNSEVGNGAFRITPEITVQICGNGMTMTRDAMKEIHLGGELPPGVQWSDKTRRRNLELVAAKTEDVVSRFLSVDYVNEKVEELAVTAGVEITKPEETIKVVCKSKGVMFSEADAAGILGMFVRGGQMTAGGVLQAVTAYSQTIPDADTAFDLNSRAVAAMEVAARVGAATTR